MIDTTQFKHLYPFESNWLDLDGIRYHYLDEGSRDAPVVVMLHGNPTWSFYYRTLIPAISKNHRVIVPDHIGCGLSDKPQKYTYNLEQHIQNLETLLTHLGIEQMSLVVHDWGGAIGMGYAIRHPKSVSRFVILNTAAFVLKKMPKRILICRPKYFGALLVRGFNAFAGVATYQGVTATKMSSKVRAGYLAPYNNWDNRIAIHRFVEDIPWEDDHPTRPLLEEIDKGLTQFKDYPMLIIWGGKDFCFTERDFFSEWQRRFPRASTYIFADAGHYIVEDKHKEIVPLVEKFLNKN